MSRHVLSIRHVWLALCLLVLAAAPAAAASDSAAPDPITSFTLDNGMQVVVIPDHRAPIVTHMVWYRIGSADEPPGKSGIAHFFEHLMFKGTTNHKAGEFGAKIAEIGGSENAFTTDDYTAYYQTVPPEALGTMMEFEADRMRNLILTDAVIGPERDVILEERRSSKMTSRSGPMTASVRIRLRIRSASNSIMVPSASGGTVW